MSKVTQTNYRCDRCRHQEPATRGDCREPPPEWFVITIKQARRHGPGFNAERERHLCTECGNDIMSAMVNFCVYLVPESKLEQLRKSVDAFDERDAPIRGDQ